MVREPTTTISLRDLRSTAPAVTRSAALLELLAEPGNLAMGPTEIARRLQLPKSTVANLLIALERAELVRNNGGRYELGPKLLELSAAYLAKVDIFQEFHEACRRLRWLSQEVVNLATLEGSDILILARHYGTQFVTLTAGVGHRQPAQATALGKAMLAQLDSTDAFERLSTISPFPVFTPKSKRNLSELMDDLDATRQRGYAIDDEENTLGLTSFGIAIPRSGGNGNPMAVSVSLLRVRRSDELVERLITDLRELVDTLARHDRARHGPSSRRDRRLTTAYRIRRARPFGCEVLRSSRSGRSAAVFTGRHQRSRERDQPEHRRVDDHPFGPTVADRTECGLIAPVTDHHEHHEPEPDGAREGRHGFHRSGDHGGRPDRLEVEAHESDEREQSVRAAAV